MSLTYTVHASLQQAALDILLAVLLLTSVRLFGRWWHQRAYRRERAERDAAELAVWRQHKEAAFERRNRRRRRRP